MQGLDEEEGYGAFELDSGRAIVGLVARRIVPGTDPVRFIVTILLGVAGASLGSFFTGVLGGTGARDFNLWSVLVATAGALGLLYLFAWITRRTA